MRRDSGDFSADSRHDGDIRSARDTDSVLIAKGQVWELPSSLVADRVQLRVVDVANGPEHVMVGIHTVRSSAPAVVIDRETVRSTWLVDTAILVAGPGAADVRRLRDHLLDLLRYAARTDGHLQRDGDVRVDVRDLVRIVARDETISLRDARHHLRGALALLGGSEIAYSGNGIEEYLIPSRSLQKAA